MTTAARACPACATPLPEEAQFCMHCGRATPTDPGVPPRTATTGMVEVAQVKKALAGRYQVERVLGEGGMATVYLAHDQKHNRKVAASENIPKTLSTMLQAYDLSPLMFLLFVNVALLVLGCFLEGTTIILVILPVMLPTAQALGIDPVHFGVMAVVNIMLGLVTPPYGLLLFMMTKIADVPLRDIVRESMPYLSCSARSR